MDRLREVSRFWNWLPAFRAAAETQHLPSAAKHLMTSASALSRSIRLLEKNLGLQLFRRVGRRLELAPEGARLLEAVRDAMRLVHESTAQLGVASRSHEIRIAGLGVGTTVLLAPAIAVLRSRNPAWTAIVSTPPLDDLRQALLRGSIDLALHSAPFAHDGLVSEPIAIVHSSIYCGPGHPLFTRRRVTFAEVLAHDFAAPPLAKDGTTQEGWPPHLARKVGLQVDQIRVGFELCARGNFLAILPDLLVESQPIGAQLRRLPGPPLTNLVVFATRRHAVRRGGFVETLVAELSKQAAMLGVALPAR